MPRKVFISFLGVSYYEPARYVSSELDESDSEEVRFVQEAVAAKHCASFSEKDIIYIFTTDRARSNWEDGEHLHVKTDIIHWYEGLGTRLHKLSLECSIERVEIPDGKSTSEIWSIFQTVYGKLEEGDSLIFDITHGFRSLPMLNMVLINYAKLLKNISIKGIYYGAFDAQYQKEGDFFSPIWDLSDFQVVQEWSNNANIFLKTGNAIPLASLMDDARFGILKQNLIQFSQFTLVNRGMDIYDGKVMMTLNEELSREIVDTNTSLNALKPILARIKDEFKNYQQNSTYNGLLAVRWCIQNGLIQQAATLLEEFIVTFSLVELGEGDSLKVQFKRDTVSSVLAISNDAVFNYMAILDENNPEDPGVWQRAAVTSIRNSPYRVKLGRLLYDIKNSIRNDINHAGFREEPRDYVSFEGSIKKRYNETRNLINKLKSIELPPI